MAILHSVRKKNTHCFNCSWKSSGLSSSPQRKSEVCFNILGLRLGVTLGWKYSLNSRRSALKRSPQGMNKMFQEDSRLEWNVSCHLLLCHKKWRHTFDWTLRRATLRRDSEKSQIFRRSDIPSRVDCGSLLQQIAYCSCGVQNNHRCTTEIKVKDIGIWGSFGEGYSLKKTNNWTNQIAGSIRYTLAIHPSEEHWRYCRVVEDHEVLEALSESYLETRGREGGTTRVRRGSEAKHACWKRAGRNAACVGKGRTPSRLLLYSR